MTKNVIPLKQHVPADDIAHSLRNIADRYEKGEYGFATTCVVCIGHTEQKPSEEGQIMKDTFEMFGCGPRSDIYTIRGLILTCATQI